MTDLTPQPRIAAQRFRPQKTHLFIIALILVLCIIVAGFAPWLVATFLAPLIHTLWIFRARTIIGPRGITAAYLLSKCRSAPWNGFTGIFLSKGDRVFAITKLDERITPLAIPFNSLPGLKEATGGLIPDPIVSAHMVGNGRVEVLDRDGYSVMRKISEVKADAEPKGDASAE